MSPTKMNGVKTERGLGPRSNVMVQEACFHMELLQVGREELIQEWSESWIWNRWVECVGLPSLHVFSPAKMEKHPRHEDLHPMLRTRRSQQGGERNGLDDSKTGRARILTL